MKAKITISRTQSRNDEEPIRISVVDESSGVSIMELAMTLADFAECLTGLGRAESRITRIVDAEGFARIGKELKIKSASCAKVKSHSKDEQRAAVLSDFYENYAPAGWVIKSDGTTTRQDGQQHNYIIARWD